MCPHVPPLLSLTSLGAVSSPVKWDGLTWLGYCWKCFANPGAEAPRTWVTVLPFLLNASECVSPSLGFLLPCLSFRPLFPPSRRPLLRRLNPWPFLLLQVESSLSGTCTPFQKPVVLRSVALNLSSGRIAGRALTGSLPQTQAAGGPGFVGLESPPRASQHSQAENYRQRTL